MAGSGRGPDASSSESSTASPETSVPRRTPNLYTTAASASEPLSNQETTSATFSKQALANLHRAPINPGEFRNKCRFCPSTFAKSEHLKRHERSHTKERPYICSICGKKFTRGDSLTRHLRLHENGNVIMDNGPGEDTEEGEVSLDGKAKKKLIDSGDDGNGEGKSRRTRKSASSPLKEEGEGRDSNSELDYPMVSLADEMGSALDHANPSSAPEGLLTGLVQSSDCLTGHGQYSRSPHDKELVLDPALSEQQTRHTHDGGGDHKRRRISGSESQRNKSYPGYDGVNSLSVDPGANTMNQNAAMYSQYDEYFGSSLPRAEQRGVSNSFGGLSDQRSSITLSDLYAGRTHGESVRSTYQHEWSSRSQTGERETGEEDGDPATGRRETDTGGSANERVLETGSTSGPIQRAANATNPVRPPFDTSDIAYPSPQSYLASQYSDFPQPNLSSLMYPTTGTHIGMAPPTAHSFANDRSYRDNLGQGTSDLVREQGRIKAEVEREIEIANADNVYGPRLSPREEVQTAGPGQSTAFRAHDQRQMPPGHAGAYFASAGDTTDMGMASGLPTGYEGMDLSSFGEFDFSSPSHLDLLRLLASDSSLAFGHTLIPQYHTYTRRNSPVLEGTSNVTGEMNFEIGESAFPGTQLARHPHMEIDVQAWATDDAPAGRPVGPAAEHPDTGREERGLTATTFDNPTASADFDISQFGVSMDVAHFWSSLMGHGHGHPSHLPLTQTPLPDLAPTTHGLDPGIDFRTTTQPTSNVGSQSVRREAPEQPTSGPGAGSLSSLSFRDKRGSVNPLEIHPDGQKGSKHADAGGVTNNRSLSLETPPFSLSGSLGRPQEAINEARCLITDLAYPTYLFCRQGEALWRLVYKGVGASWDRLMELRNGPHDHTKGTPLLQTIMLGQLFAALSSKQSVRRSPFTFQGLGLRIARLCGMYLDPNIACDIDLPSDGCSEAELDIAWRTWAARETQLRALLGSMVVDGQFMSLFHTGTTVRHLCNEFPASCPDALWNAVTAAQWRDQVKIHADSQELRRKQSFASVYRKLLDEQHGGLDISLHYPLASLGKAVLIVGLSSVIADCRESRQLDQIYGQHPPLVLVTALRRLYRQLLHGVKNPVESIGLKMGWHDLCLQFLLSQSVDKASMRATANRPPAVPDNLPVCDETYSYTRTSVGRRILLHANAIRQLAEQFPFSAMTSPQFFIPRFCHFAALSLLGYIKGNKDKTANHRTYDLAREVDWDALGAFGFSPSDRLTSYDAHSITSIDKEFISQGGIVELNGHSLQEEDLANFVIWLKSFGNIYGIAQVYSEDVRRRMMH
ncbi:hypothetical protein QFC19_004182 [Naganishia cerealis]|uniref:Uncharacterized protein n=1 Tax=Naganishia cerealis TaxID=610337 RepID=A0ACC2VX90_9TREE|nr:hypothetical protein QFC19_004182 [Naganishia cerealis]